MNRSMLRLTTSVSIALVMIQPIPTLAEADTAAQLCAKGQTRFCGTGNPRPEPPANGAGVQQPKPSGGAGQGTFNLPGGQGANHPPAGQAGNGGQAAPGNHAGPTFQNPAPTTPKLAPLPKVVAQPPTAPQVKPGAGPAPGTATGAGAAGASSLNPQGAGKQFPGQRGAGGATGFANGATGAPGPKAPGPKAPGPTVTGPTTVAPPSGPKLPGPAPAAGPSTAGAKLPGIGASGTTKPGTATAGTNTTAPTGGAAAAGPKLPGAGTAGTAQTGAAPAGTAGAGAKLPPSGATGAAPAGPAPTAPGQTATGQTATGQTATGQTAAGQRGPKVGAIGAAGLGAAAVGAAAVGAGAAASATTSAPAATVTAVPPATAVVAPGTVQSPAVAAQILSRPAPVPGTGAAFVPPSAAVAAAQVAQAPNGFVPGAPSTTLGPALVRGPGQEFGHPPIWTGEGPRGNGFATFGLLALGAVAVGAILANQGRVISNSGDRVIVLQPGGRYYVYHDDDVLLRQPGAVISTQTYGDGTVLTEVIYPNGVRIVTVRDPFGRVLSRTRYAPDGRRYVLFDDSRPVQAVYLPSLPQRSPVDVVITPQTSVAALRAALMAQPIHPLTRHFALEQVRDTPELRYLAPAVEVDSVPFASGSSVVTPDQAQALGNLGQAMADIVARNPGEVFLIEGHSDAVGDPATNLALSDRRAESIALALTAYYGVPPENMVTQGYGETDLKEPTQGSDSVNRRVVVRRITDLLEPPPQN